MLDEHAALVDALVEDLGADLVGGGLPALDALVVLAQPRQARAAVARDPAHHLGGHEVLGLAADLPDAAVGEAPVLDRRLDQAAEQRPDGLGQLVARLGVQVDRVQDRAPDVVLALVERAVADPYRPGALVAVEVVERVLGQLAARRRSRT